MAEKNGEENFFNLCCQSTLTWNSSQIFEGLCFILDISYHWFSLFEDSVWKELILRCKLSWWRVYHLPKIRCSSLDVKINKKIRIFSQSVKDERSPCSNLLFLSLTFLTSKLVELNTIILFLLNSGTYVSWQMIIRTFKSTTFFKHWNSVIFRWISLQNQMTTLFPSKIRIQTLDLLEIKCFF